jgi:hypothetical protein
MLDLVVDSCPTFDGLRTFYMLSPMRPVDVLDLVRRRLSWLEFSGEAVALHEGFEQQVEDSIGAYLMSVPSNVADHDALERSLCDSTLAITFGATRLLPFDQVTEFLRLAAERGEDISPLHFFVNRHLRSASWPSPELRFKPGQAVWVCGKPGDWLRGTVLETHTAVPSFLIEEGGLVDTVAAYSVRIILRRGTGMWIMANIRAGIPLLTIPVLHPAEAPAPASSERTCS